MHKLADLRAGDVIIYLAVARCHSVNGAARELNVPASQVSKAVARLEHQLGMTLMVRSARGITISDDGHRVLPQLTELVQRIQGLVRREDIDAPLVVAGPSYMITWCAPRIAEALPGTRVRALEMAPALIRTHAASNVFDVCITLADERLPESWQSEHVGDMRRSCFAPPALAAELGPAPVPLATILRTPFVLPVYNASGVYVPVDDGCPLPATQRVAGHEAQTMALALEIACATNQLVFGPLMAAHPYLAAGRMVEVEVEGWHEHDPVHVACNVDRVRVQQQRAIAKAVRAALASLTVFCPPARRPALEPVARETPALRVVGPAPSPRSSMAS